MSLINQSCPWFWEKQIISSTIFLAMQHNLLDKKKKTWSLPINYHIKSTYSTSCTKYISAMPVH